MSLSSKAGHLAGALSLAAVASGAFTPVAAQALVGSTADPAASRMADAANGFLATLSKAQRKAVLFRFDDDAQRRRWSNFPTGFVPRGGLRWGDLDARQRAALMALLGAVLSPDGVRMVREQMAADDELRLHPRGPGPGAGARRGPPPGGTGGPPPGFPPGPPGGPGGRASASFGSNWYYVSLLGTPSTTAPWMLQFGGHHLAINATVVGSRTTLSPSLTGGEPLRLTFDGRRVYIVEKEVTAAAALLAGMSAAQRAKAVVSGQRIDLVLGPGQDGRVLQPEGIAGADLTPAQKAGLLAVIEARLGILDAGARELALAAVRADLDRTYFAWFGAAAPLGDAYWRVTGPTVLIEYAPQDMDGDATDHAHNMYRDPTNEYGAKWTGRR